MYSIIRYRTRYFRHAYPLTRDNMYITYETEHNRTICLTEIGNEKIQGGPTEHNIWHFFCISKHWPNI
jgi:hypothetical protein